MKRCEIEEKYKWDLTKMYSSIEEYEKDFNAVKKDIPKLAEYKSKFLDSVEGFLEFMRLEENISRRLDKLYEYTYLATITEPDNDELQYWHSNIAALTQDYDEAVNFVDTQVIQRENDVINILKDKRCEEYKTLIREILRYKPHTLDYETEKLLTLAGNTMNSYSTYSAINLEYKPVIIDGKEYFLNDATLNEFLRNSDENVRRQAYENIYTEYKKFSNLYAKTLSGKIKQDIFFAIARKYNSALEHSTYADDVNPELFYKILEVANKKYHGYFLEYLYVVNKILKKDKITNYDLKVPLCNTPKSEYTLENAWELVFEATKVLGKEYKEILVKAKEERWIDYYPHDGKRQGAFSAGVYDSVPYIMTNFTGDLESVFTIAHELGHSVHSYLSNKNQKYNNSHYRIFVAEVASTVNENLLLEYLIKNATSKEEKMYYLYRKLDEFIGCCYRQPFFANFEDILHKKAQSNQGLSVKSITDIYAELSEEYYGGKVEQHELSKYACFSVPHFYYNYYVYKYTIGNCVASVIASRILAGDKTTLEKYLEFLKSGCTKSPVELLKLVGVNPLDDQLYKEAFEEFKKVLDEFKKLSLE